MITRRAFAERQIRQFYGGFPTDDAQLTPNLVNTWVNEGVALAAKANYKDNQNVEGVGFTNDSFSTTFKNLTITPDGQEVGLFHTTLPEIPLGLGENEGLKRVRLTDKSETSAPVILISIRESDFLERLPKPDGVFAWNEGNDLNFYSPEYTLLADYKAKVTMVSGGNGASTNLDAPISVPDDYMPMVNDYVQKQLLIFRNGKIDTANDGNDIQ